MTLEAPFALPPPLDIGEHHTNDVATELAYLRFRFELVEGREFTVDGLPVHVTDTGRAMEANTSYWHIVTEEQGVMGRTFVRERACCIPYIRPLLVAADSGYVPAWENERHTAAGIQSNISLAPPDFSFLVVLRLASTRGHLLLWTAYPIRPGRQRDRVSREHATCKRKIGGAP